jgi:hypothetical protein
MVTKLLGHKARAGVVANNNDVELHHAATNIKWTEEMVHEVMRGWHAFYAAAAAAAVSAAVVVIIPSAGSCPPGLF